MQNQKNSKFIKVRCTKCKNEQIIFDRASTKLDCLVCGTPLAKNSGGKVVITATVLEVLD